MELIKSLVEVWVICSKGEAVTQSTEKNGIKYCEPGQDKADLQIKEQGRGDTGI